MSFQHDYKNYMNSEDNEFLFNDNDTKSNKK